jgi:hypothetical protein
VMKRFVLCGVFCTWINGEFSTALIICVIFSSLVQDSSCSSFSWKHYCISAIHYRVCYVVYFSSVGVKLVIIVPSFGSNNNWNFCHFACNQFFWTKGTSCAGSSTPRSTSDHQAITISNDFIYIF